MEHSMEHRFWTGLGGYCNLSHLEGQYSPTSEPGKPVLLDRSVMEQAGDRKILVGASKELAAEPDAPEPEELSRFL